MLFKIKPKKNLICNLKGIRLFINVFPKLLEFVCICTVPKYRAAVDYTPRLRAPRNLPGCTANSNTFEAVANNYPGLATANSYLGTTST